MLTEVLIKITDISPIQQLASRTPKYCYKHSNHVSWSLFYCCEDTMTKETLIKESISLELAFSFRALIHYFGGKHGSGAVAENFTFLILRQQGGVGERGLA